MYEILSSRSHIFCQLTCLLLGVFVILQTGLFAPISTEWVFVGVDSTAPAIIVILLNPLIMLITAFALDLVSGDKPGSATYEITQSMMQFVFCMAACVIMLCQLMVFIKV